uniref:Coagulation factor VIII, procoagulant component n=1 Tax=Salarias fasciatus TaxID=181472 RepID=A0A672IZC6_SALFA
MEPSRAISAALALLLPLVCASAGAAQQGAKPAAHYYIAAVEIGWDYIYLDEADPTADQRQTLLTTVNFRASVCLSCLKDGHVIFAGIQGPVIAAQAGDKVVIHFKNLASQPYSISPVGITYSKHSEGVGYDDSTAGQEKEDDAVSPGGYYEYVWDINHEDGPTASDPDCLTYTYSSQVDPVRDLNSGLIGALLICKSGVLTDSRQRKSPAFVLLFAVFDETKSWYGEVGERVSRERFKRTKGRKEYHTINGYVNSTLPGLTMCQGRSPVFWHLIGVGTAPEIHSIRFQDHSLQVLTHRKLTIEVTPLTLITAEMRPYTTGRFPISCQINAHQHDGMEATFTVEKCPEKVAPPVPDVRKVKHKHIKEEEEEDDYYDDMFNTISIQPKKPAFQARSSRGQQSQTWVHYIAAEEITWDYTPHLSTADSEMQSRYLLPAPHHLGYTYKKVAYVEYTDESFTQRKNPGAALLGPLLKGKVNDQFHITFRNMASRPFNIYPNGLSKIYPLQRSTNGKLHLQHNVKKDLRSMEVPPNGTFGYVWRLTTDDGPLEGDPTCLTHLYQSTISPERDLASGLVGTLLICRHDAIDVRGKLVRRARVLIFAVFDENKSWYFNENMQRSRENSSSTTDPEFYDSNVIYSVNGIMFSRRQFVMCKSDVLFWHVVSVGTQSDFLSVYFPGNLFQYDGLYRSVLTLFPMTGVTVPMEMELIGKVEEENSTSDLFATDYLDMRSGEIRPRHYYIAAEEIIWDYGIRTPPEMRRGMRKFLPEYKKVVFRAYRDKEFLRPVGRGELEEHLGIMGPVIRTEINDLLTVRETASSSSASPGVSGEPVPPGETRTYNWRVTWKQGPTESEFDCKTGAYYSTVDKDRDLNSGLIGPLVICKSGTLQTHLNTQIGIQEFSLLFHTFDETKSWYMEENLQRYCAPPCQANTADPWYHTTINGYVAETLPGLVMAQRQPVRWHLLNVGSDREYHAVHFHGLPFTVHAKEEHRMGVYNLFPGVFGTVEMNPPTVGTWLVECTVGDYQLAGMRAKLLVYNPQCASPLGMKSGRIEDYQITASDHIDYWEPRLARLDQSGYINAWMGRSKKSWLQVDLQKPTLLHGVQTQGVRSRLRGHYITFFSVSYSLDQETWTTYRGNSSGKRYNFHGNLDSSKVKENRFSPPFVARYIRIQPNGYENKPALRLELLGCDVNSCSLPLGRQMRLINDSSFTASSTYSSMLLSWGANLAQLHKKGRANAWRPKTNNPHEWLQVDLWAVRRITGVITQGAQSLLTKLMVTEFSVTVSRDGESWSSVLEERSQREKVRRAQALTVFEPPLFGRFLRIHPRGWINGIALRLEVLGCDAQ